MIPISTLSPELADLLESLCLGEITPEEAERLEELALSSDENCRHFVVFLHMHALAERFLGADAEREAKLLEAQLFSQSAPAPSSLPLVVPLPASSSIHANSGFFNTAYHGTVNFFSQEIPFACLMATLFMIVGGIIGLSITKEHYTQMPGQSVASAERSYADAESDVADKARAAAKEQKEVFQFVGRVTGMVDCKWAAPDRTFSSITDYSVTLHDKYSLTSGLMEITYYTGAKVILQGPVTYEVESANGGYMSIGKLTGKVEVEKAKGFAVRTPTAVVTDLGTEFGVNVNEVGETLASVYRGQVELRLVAGDGTANAQAISLGENQSARAALNQAKVARIIAVSDKEPPVSFTRAIPKRARIKTFNTGIGLKERDADPHWQFVARSDDPNFKPKPAYVLSSSLPPPDLFPFAPNDPAHSQWISNVGDITLPEAALPGNATYTFRTTFDMVGMQPDTARLLVQYCADNYISAIRLNGEKVSLQGTQDKLEYTWWPPRTSVWITRGFVEGTNVLEFDVENHIEGDPGSLTGISCIALRVELEGTAITAK